VGRGERKEGGSGESGVERGVKGEKRDDEGDKSRNGAYTKERVERHKLKKKDEISPFDPIGPQRSGDRLSFFLAHPSFWFLSLLPLHSHSLCFDPLACRDSVPIQHPILLFPFFPAGDRTDPCIRLNGSPKQQYHQDH